MRHLLPILTIDGPSGSGKGTISRLLAARLGWHLLDSGALYRLVALAGSKQRLGIEDELGHAQLASTMSIEFGSQPDGGERVELDGQDVTLEIRTEQAGQGASKVATWPKVRLALLERQRRFVRAPGLVADGRDMGTVVFPAAPCKLFLTASIEERAQRRYKQLIEKGYAGSLADLSRAVAERDQRDSTRAVAPLRPASDAIVIDSTGMTVEQVVEKALVEARLAFGIPAI